MGAIGPVIYSSGRVQSAGIAIKPWGRIHNTQLHPNVDSWVDAVSGACMLVPSWVRFDVGFPHGFEDIELSMRLKTMGYQNLVVSKAVCQHLGGGTLGYADPQKIRHSVYGHLRLLKSHRYIPIVAGLAVLQVLSEDRDRDRLLSIFKGVRDWSYRNSRATRRASSMAGSKIAK